MSGQQQRVRRNVSPAASKQGPLKATVPVAALIRPNVGVPSPSDGFRKISPIASDCSQGTTAPQKVPSVNKLSPEQRISPEWKTFTSESPVPKGRNSEKYSNSEKENLKTAEKPKPLAPSSVHVTVSTSKVVPTGSSGFPSANGAVGGGGASFIRRTGSLDTLYLASSNSPWIPREQRDPAYYGSYCGRLMVDTATQTPEEWDDMDRKKGQQKKIAEGLEMKFIRQRLQRSTQISRSSNPSNAMASFTFSQSPLNYSSTSSGGVPSQFHPTFSPVQGAPTFNSPPCISANVSSNLSSPAHHSNAAPHSSTPSNTTPQFQSSGAGSSNCSLSPNSSGGGALHQNSVAIPIPNIPKPLIPRMRSSVEGLNQEIEKLVLRGISGNDQGDCERMREPTPDGHRAPIAKLFRTAANSSSASSLNGTTANVDTQTATAGNNSAYQPNVTGRTRNSERSNWISTGMKCYENSSYEGGNQPSSGDGESCGSSGNTSRSQSVSPTILPLIPGTMDRSRPTSSDIRKSASPDDLYNCDDKLGSSPKINQFMARDPPDGCEKIKLIEEPKQSNPLLVEPASGHSCMTNMSGLILRPSVNFVLMPSQSSAFHPLYKSCLPQSSGSNNSGICSSVRERE